MVAKGIQRYLMHSHMAANSCHGSPWLFDGLVNRNKLYSQYLTVLRVNLPVFKI